MLLVSPPHPIEGHEREEEEEMKADVELGGRLTLQLPPPTWLCGSTSPSRRPTERPRSRISSRRMRTSSLCGLLRARREGPRRASLTGRPERSTRRVSSHPGLLPLPTWPDAPTSWLMLVLCYDAKHVLQPRTGLVS